MDNIFLRSSASATWSGGQHLCRHLHQASTMRCRGSLASLFGCSEGKRRSLYGYVIQIEACVLLASLITLCTAASNTTNTSDIATERNKHAAAICRRPLRCCAPLTATLGSRAAALAVVPDSSVVALRTALSSKNRLIGMHRHRFLHHCSRGRNAIRCCAVHAAMGPTRCRRMAIKNSRSNTDAPASCWKPLPAARTENPAGDLTRAIIKPPMLTHTANTHSPGLASNIRLRKSGSRRSQSAREKLALGKPISTYGSCRKRRE